MRSDQANEVEKFAFSSEKQKKLQKKEAEAHLERLMRLEPVVLFLRTAPGPTQINAATPTPRKQRFGLGAAQAHPHLLSLVAPAGCSSAIVPDLPKLLGDFKKNQFTLLWRCFHNRSDGQPNTLTMILAQKGTSSGIHARGVGLLADVQSRPGSERFPVPAH
jgi:hypothetical protein